MRLILAWMIWLFCWYRMNAVADKSWDFVGGMALVNLCVVMAYETY